MELSRAHSGREACHIHLKESLPIGRDPREVLSAFRVSGWKVAAGGATATQSPPLSHPIPNWVCPCCSAAPCCLRCCCRCCCSSLLQAAVNMSADEIEAWLARPESRQAVEQGEEEADKEGRHAARR